MKLVGGCSHNPMTDTLSYEEVLQGRQNGWAKNDFGGVPQGRKEVLVAMVDVEMALGVVLGSGLCLGASWEARETLFPLPSCPMKALGVVVTTVAGEWSHHMLFSRT